MRKIYLCGIFILFSSLLQGKAPFGVFENSLQEGSNPKQLWNYILNGWPITLDLVLPVSEEPNRAEWEKYIQNSFNMWFSDTAKMIEQSGRAEEFTDVLPILKRGLRFGPDGLEEHVIVHASVKDLRQIAGEEAIASANRKKRTIRILTQAEFDRTIKEENVSPEPLWSTIAHEFGHQLGFIGQYPKETSKDIDEVAPYSYSSQTNVKETVMSAVRHRGKVGCEDTDGIINMIDLQRKGAQGRRAGKTWKSFCKESKDEFRDGKRVNGLANHQIRRVDGYWGEWNVDRGFDTKKYSLRLSITPQEISNVKEIMVLGRDKNNRPIETQTNNGAIVYYEYFQAVTRKAAFINDALAWVETVYQNHKNNEYVHELEFWGNQPITITWSKPSSFSYKEWPSAEIKFACKKTSAGKLDCNIEKDDLLYANNSYWLGDFRYLNRQSIEYKTAKTVAIKTLLKWFEQLPDKPLQ